MDNNITEEQANEGLKMLVGDTRKPFSDFWRLFNKEKKKEEEKLERALMSLSFEKKLELISKVNDLIFQYSEKK